MQMNGWKPGSDLIGEPNKGVNPRSVFKGLFFVTS